MKVISDIASILCLYLVFQGWDLLWDIHFLLPLGLLVTMLAAVMVFIVTAEDRKKTRSDRIFEACCDQWEMQR